MEKGGREELVGLLRSSSIFSDLSEDQIQSLGQLARIEEYPPETMILKEGELSTRFYSILDGQVEVHLQNKEPKRLGRGDFFGETALVANLARSAGVLALRKTRCVVLQGSELRSYPGLVLRLLKESSRRERSTPSPKKESVAPPARGEEPWKTGPIEFKSERTRKVFDYAVRCFTNDYMVKRLYFEQAGWRSYGEISAGVNVPRESLYRRRGKPGPAIAELLSRGLIETRVFEGERGRGGEVVKVRIAYDKEPVKRYVDSAVLRRK